MSKKQSKAREFIHNKFRGYTKKDINNIIIPKLTIKDLEELLEEYKNKTEIEIFLGNEGEVPSFSKVKIKENIKLSAPDDCMGEIGVIMKYDSNDKKPYTIKFDYYIEGSKEWYFSQDEFDIID